MSMPKPVHDFITKLAAVEGSKPDEWYANAIVRDIQALLSDAHDVFDVSRLVKPNGLEGIVGEVP
jgi:hypothetical protein